MIANKYDYEKLLNGRPIKQKCSVLNCQEKAKYIYSMEAVTKQLEYSMLIDFTNIKPFLCNTHFDNFNKLIWTCENCMNPMEGYGNSSYFLKPQKIIKVCDNCNKLEINLRMKAN